MEDFFRDVRENTVQLIDQAVQQYHVVKVKVEVFAIYYLDTLDMMEMKSFNTRNQVITSESDLYEVYDEYTDEIVTKASEFQERGSGWALVSVEYLEVNVNKYNSTRSSSYIDLPEVIKKKKAVINVQNWDNACFAWSITSALRLPTGQPQRTSSYPHYSTVADFSGIEFPMKLSDISRFEQCNNISIIVYGLNSYFDNNRMVTEIVGPLYFSKNRKLLHINLLMVSDDDGNSHYCWIKNLSRLVTSQTNRHEHEKFICEGCLMSFTSYDNLLRHQTYDCNHVAAKLPTTQTRIDKYGKTVPQNVLQFENFEKQLRVPFVVYADFETILKPLATVEPDPEKPFTIKSYEHEPYSFAYYLKCAFDDTVSKLELYRGADAPKVFIERLERDVREVYRKYLSVMIPMYPLTAEQSRDFETSTRCHICDEAFLDVSVKVRDHDHFTGAYRGPAHSACNLNYKIPLFIPVFFHNLTGYDSHLFIKQLALFGESVDIIAQNKEKYVSFSKHLLVEEYMDRTTGKLRKVFFKLRFLDSFRFMASSLQKLGDCLSDEQCVEIRKRFPEEDLFRLVRQKGVFPYMYVDSVEKLNETKLPYHNDFYDMLHGTNVSNKEYDRASLVWRMFNCKTLGEYSDIYLTTDVLLLADVFENYRKLCLTTYKLDPAQYFTAPGFSWDAMLRITGVKLELLNDIDMLHFFKKGIRGGVSMCSRRKAIANNKFIPNYDSTKPASYIMYLDATNLYGYAMYQLLPTGNFRWLSNGEIQNFNVNVVSDESETGYVLEVDLEYPPELHDNHNDLPFCPESIVPPGSKYTKLIPNLYDKSRYVLHYRNLKQCLQHGLLLKHVHRILQFQQSALMRPYIDLNTEKRNAAHNEFDKSQYKYMNNSVFGKTMENVDNRVNIKLLTHWRNRQRRLGAEALIAKPNFKSCSIFSDNLVAIHMSTLSVTYNKPLYIGFCVLDISKIILYDFFYNYIRSMYGHNASLLYTDTDSLILHIVADNVYDDMKSNLNKFDTSNFSIDNVHGIPRNLSILGNMKDEYAGSPIRSFYGTGAKAYCIDVGSKMTKKAKGVKKYVIERTLTLADYKTVVESNGKILRKMYLFRSYLHNMFTDLKNKLVLSPHNDKRVVIPGTANTLAWGHRNLQDSSGNVEAFVKDDDELSKSDVSNAALDAIYDLLCKNECGTI